SLAMTSSPGVAPGESTTGSGNLGSNDGARNAVGLFHVVVVSGVLQKTRKSDEGRPRGAPRPSTGALCSGRRTRLLATALSHPLIVAHSQPAATRSRRTLPGIPPA